MNQRVLGDPSGRSAFALARAATVLAAVAAGALAIGALAIGALAIKRLAIGSASLKRLRIGELEIDRLSVNEAPHHQEKTSLQQFPMHAYIPARDVARARQFYEQKIGLQPKQEVAGGVVYEFGQNTACFLYPTPNAGTSKASQAFWQVDDVERAVAQLRARGVEFEHYDLPGATTQGDIVIAGGAKAAWFKDTEGNILAIIDNY